MALTHSHNTVACEYDWDEKTLSWKEITQFTFASGEERKVFKIIEKYDGQIIPNREDLNQWAFDETNLSGKSYQVENVNEYLNA